MDKRLLLHETLSSIEGVKQTWFQAPPNTSLIYPCIVYKIDDENREFANNGPYSRRKRYMITVMTKEPDSNIPDIVGALPLTRFSRNYVANNLNHNVYTIYI